MAVILRCPHCETKFKVAYGTKDGEGWPDYCPNKSCGVYMGISHKDDVVMPIILHDSSKGYDKLYRDMEKGSEFRAQKAADDLGVPVSEMSAIKITDMKDNPKEGESSVKEVVNPVSTFMQQTGIGGFQGPNGAGYSGAVQTGPFPNAGAQMRTALQNSHAQLTGGAAVSDRPALETSQPGYRRRG